MSRPLAEFTGNSLYLDTMILYALLRGLEPLAEALFARVERGELHTYTSVLTFDELAYRMLLAFIRDHYPGSPLDHLRQEKKKMIADFYPQITPQLQQLRQYPNLILVDTTIVDIEEMDQAILQYNLLPRDALHLVAMRRCGCTDLLSEDADFDQVPDLRRYTLR